MTASRLAPVLSALLAPSGEYVLTDEAGFDPNVSGTRNWTLLKQAR